MDTKSLELRWKFYAFFGRHYSKRSSFWLQSTVHNHKSTWSKSMRKSFFVRRSSRFGTTNLPFFEAGFKQTRTKLIVDNSANCYLPLLCPQNDMKTTKNIRYSLSFTFKRTSVWKIIKNVCFFPRHTINHPVDNIAVITMFLWITQFFHKFFKSTFTKLFDMDHKYISLQCLRSFSF